MILSINFLYNQMDSNLTSVVLDNKVIKVMNHSYNIDDITDVEFDTIIIYCSKKIPETV